MCVAPFALPEMPWLTTCCDEHDAAQASTSPSIGTTRDSTLTRKSPRRSSRSPPYSTATESKLPTRRTRRSSNKSLNNEPTRASTAQTPEEESKELIIFDGDCIQVFYENIETFYETDPKVSGWNDTFEVIDCTKADEPDYVVINASAAPSGHKKSVSMNLCSEKTFIPEELKYVNSRNNTIIFAVAAAAAIFAITAKVSLSETEYKESMKDFGSDAGSMWVPTKWWTCLNFQLPD